MSRSFQRQILSQYERSIILVAIFDRCFKVRVSVIGSALGFIVWVKAFDYYAWQPGDPLKKRQSHKIWNKMGHTMSVGRLEMTVGRMPPVTIMMLSPTSVTYCLLAMGNGKTVGSGRR